MSYKLIMALAGGGPEDAETLTFAAALAVQHGAVVQVLPIHPDAAVDLIALGMTLGTVLSPEMQQSLSEAQSHCQARIDTAARAAAGAVDLAFGDGADGPRMIVHPHSTMPVEDLARALVLADLVVIGQGYLRGPGRDGRVLGQVLLDQRVPVLIARGQPERLTGRIAIAWNGSVEAGRAVHGALPLIARGVGPDPVAIRARRACGGRGHRHRPAEQLAAPARRGPRATGSGDRSLGGSGPGPGCAGP